MREVGGGVSTTRSPPAPPLTAPPRIPLPPETSEGQSRGFFFGGGGRRAWWTGRSRRRRRLYVTFRQIEGRRRRRIRGPGVLLEAKGGAGARPRTLPSTAAQGGSSVQEIGADGLASGPPDWRTELSRLMTSVSLEQTMKSWDNEYRVTNYTKYAEERSLGWFLCVIAESWTNYGLWDEQKKS